MRFVIASNSNWYNKLIENLIKSKLGKFYFFGEKSELRSENLREINPCFIFFPHWSFLIPKSVYENYECVIFHITDLPFGRGGSPLQNLIARGIYETQISALRCEEKLDAGPIYLKRPLSLYGSAEEIYLRASKIIEEMIKEIIRTKPKPKQQQGKQVCFKRRCPQESDIRGLNNLDKLFDYIRMLDAEGYPKAFIETKNFRFEFERASLKKDKIIADVKIMRKENE